MPDPFPSGVYSLSRFFLVDTKASQERTLDGGAERPLGIKVSWDSSSEEGGAAHGPLHPALSTSKLLGFGVLSGMFWQKGFCLGLLFWGFALRKIVWFFEPFKLRALSCRLVLVFLGPL